MTCIAGIARNGFVTIGGDSRGVAGLACTDRADEKVFAVPCGSERVVIGCTSSFRMIQVLRYRLNLPSIDTWDVRRWMSVTFVDAARSAFAASGWTMRDSDGAEMGGSFLVGIRDHLFEVESDFQVGVPRCGYAAAGCGDRYALGSLFTQDAKLEPSAAVTKALEAASFHSAGVAPPYVLLSTKL